MSDPIHEIERIFAPEGPLAAAVPGFRPRPQQLEMAQRIAAAIAGNLALVTEAGTGTGKTFAYLAPALLSGGKVIVSTGTKTLQDQLFNRDLPTVRDALKVGATIALLKGRANYVCPYHLERAMSAGRLASREEAAHLRKIARFAERTRTGDKAECIDVPEDSGAWAQATSTRENCLGQECPNVKECFVLAARQDALTADVVVVNHHLFFADVMLKDEGMGELLPACNTIIFDEAHQLPEVAGLFFGESVSTSQVIELARDTRNEAVVAAKDYPPLQEAAQALDKAARDLRLAVKGENQRLPAARLESDAAFDDALQGLAAAIKELGRHLETQAERGEGLANCLRRTQELALALQRWRGGSGEGDVVKWVEVYSQAMSLNLTPLDIAPIFQRQMEGHPRAWIFASATLAVGNNFSHYCGELGLAEADTAVWGSPFDYEKNALLYAPPGMPDPNSAFYQEAVAEAAWPAIRASGGRAFVLCTSLRAMRRIRELLQEKLAADGLDLPLLMQGEGSRTELLERFRFLGNAILVASQSFWEGVDVRGEALSLVVIDKLPFAPPDDPVLSARIDRLRAAGRNPFMEYQLPRAVISMKQGSGRLIRDESDRGVLMICDPRLTGKPYGKAIWRSLPPMRRTRDVAEVEAFFEAVVPVESRHD
ncbi:ATP-dependent DNA helicase [Sulfuritalea hydrogenivorans]|uniref:ATP-dependent helicase n=1 Tax=Sulfuritalea hydrogenivorans sk43H TaxID=1223802 RepID=W0SH35_9PROT|nr:ATP-dependent DNA helicase [Sulfuritalea hydrogenivorans]BAO30272.1 ATP-dependent helicase [Sulfuritalea hydrogenivorans sk43H]